MFLLLLLSQLNFLALNVYGQKQLLKSCDSQHNPEYYILIPQNWVSSVKNISISTKYFHNIIFSIQIWGPGQKVLSEEEAPQPFEGDRRQDE